MEKTVRPQDEMGVTIALCVVKVLKSLSFPNVFFSCPQKAPKT